MLRTTSPRPALYSGSDFTFRELTPTRCYRKRHANEYHHTFNKNKATSTTSQGARPSFSQPSQHSKRVSFRKSSQRSRNLATANKCKNHTVHHSVKIYRTSPVTDQNYCVLDVDSKGILLVRPISHFRFELAQSGGRMRKEYGMFHCEPYTVQ